MPLSSIHLHRAVCLMMKSTGVKCCVHKTTTWDFHTFQSVALFHRPRLFCAQQSELVPTAECIAIKISSQVLCEAAEKHPVLCSGTCWTDLRAGSAMATAMWHPHQVPLSQRCTSGIEANKISTSEEPACLLGSNMSRVLHQWQQHNQLLLLIRFLLQASFYMIWSTTVS